jgi:hypothetical protein
MLHGHHHDEPDAKREFVSGSDLARKVREGKHYLEGILQTKIRVFVPPHNTIGRSGDNRIKWMGGQLMESTALHGLDLQRSPGTRLVLSGKAARRFVRIVSGRLCSRSF